MKNTHDILLKMVELADEIMGICGGDAWERECTRETRAEYANLRDDLDRELKRGDYSPEVIAKREAEAREVEYERLKKTFVDCPVCGQRVRVGGLHDHMKSLHSSETPAPSQFKMDKLIAYITEKGLGCRLNPITRNARQKASGHVKPLCMDDLYNNAKSASIGAVVVCPACRCEFLKKTKEQAFCSTNGRKCKDRYWNLIRSR